MTMVSRKPNQTLAGSTRKWVANVVDSRSSREGKYKVVKAKNTVSIFIFKTKNNKATLKNPTNNNQMNDIFTMLVSTAKARLSRPICFCSPPFRS